MPNEIAAIQPHGGANQDGSTSRLKSVCEDFESIFTTYMLKSMRTAFAQEGIMGNSHEMKIMNAMFDENLAREAAKGGGVGLGDILFERLSERPSERPEEVSAIYGRQEKPVPDPSGEIKDKI